MKYIPEFRDFVEQCDSKAKKAIAQVAELEGTIRRIWRSSLNVAVAGTDISDIVPVLTLKDGPSGKGILASQYDSDSSVECGLAMVNFLPLEELTDIPRCVNRIKHSTGIEFDIDNIPIDDELTYKILSEGNTVGVFQMEGRLRSFMHQLDTRLFTDLIALYALNRRGSLDKIKSLVRRKYGREEISYLLPEMEQCLKETYGLTIYPEQIIELSKQIADFSTEQSVSLYKALRHEDAAELDLLKVQFIEGGQAKGHDKETLTTIWNEWVADWHNYMSKCHATCYTWLLYQTAYLKAHYPTEYMEVLLHRAAGNKDTERCKELVDDCYAHGYLL